MKSNYKKLGAYIRPVDVRNKELSISRLLGVSIEKRFIESIANIIGTDMSTYKVVKKGQFAYGPVTSRNGEKVSIALLEEDSCIISSSYSVFEIIDTNLLLPQYLNLWFKRPEFDRYARFHSHGSAREIFDWEEMCNVELPVPPIEEQKAIVKAYETIERRIELKRNINDNLEEQAFAYFIENFEFVNKDGLKANWKKCTLSDLVPIITGKKDANTTCFNGKYPFFSCSQEILLTNDHSFNGNAVLVAGNGDFNIKWYCGEFEAYQRTYVLLPYKPYQYSFLYYVLKFHLPNAINSARGSVISFITKGILEDIECYIPISENEMRTYCEKLNAFNQAIDINKVDIQAAKRLQQTLLTKLSN